MVYLNIAMQYHNITSVYDIRTYTLLSLTLLLRSIIVHRYLVRCLTHRIHNKYFYRVTLTNIMCYNTVLNHYSFTCLHRLPV